MKKTLKKIMSVLAVVSLTACGSSAASEKKESSVKENTEAVSENAEEETKEAAPESEKTSETKEVVFEEFTPIDNDEVSVTVKELKPGSVWGYVVKVVLENKSADKTYMFSAPSTSVNGVEVESMFATEVAPGKKSNDEITLADNALKNNGITDFTDIEISMRIYDSNDWAADPAAEESFHIYPFGEENAQTFVREDQDTDQVIADNDYIRAVVTGYEPDGIFGYTVNLYLENKTDSTAMFAVENASVNGYMADPFYATSVGPGKCKFSSISWMKKTLEENDITEVETLEFTFRAYNYSDWSAGSYFEETVTLNP